MTSQIRAKAVWPSRVNVMVSPSATMVKTARIRHPHDDITAIPSCGGSAKPPAVLEGGTAGNDPLVPTVREPAPPLTVAGGLSVPRFVAYFLRAMK